MFSVTTLLRLMLAVFALRGFRWAYVFFLVLGLLYFPLKVGFQLKPHPCELTFGFRLGIFSLTNFPHIILFALCFILTSAQFRMTDWKAFVYAGLITMGFGVLVELAEGVTGQGHCRMRDLTPDTTGALIGAIIVLVLSKIGWKQRPSWSLIGWRW